MSILTDAKQLITYSLVFIKIFYKENIICMESNLARVHSLESFGSVDGPGIRYVIFLQGCNFRCRYCHNPDTWNPDGTEKSKPTLMSADELIEKALRYKPYWGKEGGITVSGGEALLQIDFLNELFRKCHERGINTCLDTSAGPFTREEPFFSKFNELMKNTDLVMLDIKQIFDEEHKKLTSHTNKNILDCATYLSDTGVPMWIRHVLVPGITTDEKELRELRKFIDTLKTVKRVEVLPYHTLGIYKYEELGIPYSLKDTNPPTEEQVNTAREILEAI